MGRHRLLGAARLGQPPADVFLLLWVAIAFLILRLVDDRPRVAP